MKTIKLDDTVELKDVYTPTREGVVVEIILQTKTASGLILSPDAMEQLTREVNPALRVIAIGPGVKDLTVGEYVFLAADCHHYQIPFIYNGREDGVRQIQVRESDVIGKVDEQFATTPKIKKEDTRLVN